MKALQGHHKIQSWLYPIFSHFLSLMCLLSEGHNIWAILVWSTPPFYFTRFLVHLLLCSWDGCPLLLLHILMVIPFFLLIMHQGQNPSPTYQTPNYFYYERRNWDEPNLANVEACKATSFNRSDAVYYVVAFEFHGTEPMVTHIFPLDHSSTILSCCRTVGEGNWILKLPCLLPDASPLAMLARLTNSICN